jgi:glycosyltransferase involved in cell wall biosynthesis
MKKVLLSAFACDPSKGSEPGNGWNWAIGLCQVGFEVHCITRYVGRKEIELNNKFTNLHFHYVALPLKLEKLYGASTSGMYLYYILWQWFAYRYAKKISKSVEFSVCHHVTWGSVQMGSFMYKLRVPLVFGPAGGGQRAPSQFRSYFSDHWNSEVKREKVGRLFLKYNPACKKMLRKAYSVLVSNPDTLEMVQTAGCNNVKLSLDVALPKSFFQEVTSVRAKEVGKLRLLWVGRFLPRKGILLLLDVMVKLKEYPNITLTVVGDGQMQKAFRDKVAKYSLENTVNWVGMVPYEDVKTFYVAHDAFIFTSLRDSGGSQLIEAMAYHLPVITINLHGQGFIVNNDTGIVCDCESPEIAIASLKDAVLNLFNNPELLEAKGDAAYKFATQQEWSVKIASIVNSSYPISKLS